MHVVAEYQPRDETPALRLVCDNPFGMLISSVRNKPPIASHLPIIVAPAAAASSESLEGTKLWGHMARTNPQWRDLDPKLPALAVFTGADAYVSAGVYEFTPAVPTWNYSAVHLTVLPEIVEDPDGVLEILIATVLLLEGRRERPWDMTESVAHFERLANGVVAFRLHVVSAQSVFKLSQDKSDALWGKVLCGLAGERDAQAQRVAADMDEARSWAE